MLQIQRLLLKRCCSSSVTRVIQEKDIKAYAELTGQGFIEGLVNFQVSAIQFAMLRDFYKVKKRIIIFDEKDFFHFHLIKY